MEPTFETTDLLPVPGNGKCRAITTRTLLNGASIILIVAVIAGTFSLWFPPLRATWQRTFPPSSYAGGYVFTLAKDGRIVAFRMSDGNIAWQTAVTSNPITQYSQLLSVNANTVIALRSHSEVIVALDKHTGRQVWQHSADTGTAFDQLYLVANVLVAHVWFEDSSSFLNEPFIETTSIGLDMQTGILLWKANFWDRDSLFANATTVFQIHYADPTKANFHPIQSQLLARNPNTGDILWSVNLPDAQLTFSLGFNGALALLASDSPKNSQSSWYLFDVTTHTIRWQTQVVQGDMAVLGDAAYNRNWAPTADQPGLQTDSPALTAIDLVSGAQRWQLAGHYYPFEAPTPASVDGKNPFATAQGIMVVGSLDGVAGVDIAHGTVRWHFHDLDQNQTSYTLNETAMLVSDLAFVWRSTNQVKAINPATGAIYWIMQVPDPDLVHLAHSDQATFVSIDNLLIAVNTITGKTLWHAKMPLVDNLTADNPFIDQVLIG